MATVAQARRTRTNWLSRIDQRHVIVYGTALVLAVTVVVPLAVMVIISLRPTAAIPPITGTDFTLDNYRTTFADPVTYRLLLNTAMYALGSMAVGLVLGILMSWFVGRTNLPFRNGVYPMALASFAMPGVVTAFGWIVLGRPRTGILNTIIRGMTGSDGNTGPLNVFTLEGMILVTGVALAGSMFIFLAPYFQRMDPALEEAATTSGAGRLGTLRHVSIPLLFPGILTVAVYYVVIMVQIFEFPLAIGVTAGVPVLSVRVFLLTQPEFGLINYGLAATFAMIAMLIGLVLLGVYLWVTRQAERYQVITGKGYRPSRMDLGFWKWPAAVFVFGIFGIKIILPLLALIWASLLLYFQPLSMDALSLVSLDNYRSVFGSERIRNSLLNTALLVTLAPTLSILLAALVAWASTRIRLRGVRMLEILAFMPLAIPGIVMGLAMLVTLIRTPIWGSVWIIIIGHTIGFLPFGVRLLSAAILQIGRELEEAGSTSGATPLTIFRVVILPLVLPAFLNGWLWVFAHSIRDFTYPLLFSTPDNAVLATQIWELWTTPDIPKGSALSVLLVVFLMAFVFVIRKTATRFFGGTVA